MKIVKIDEDGLLFDNGAKLTDYHEQDCCETVYADWKNIQVATNIGANSISAEELDFDERVINCLGFLPELGFTICDKNGIRLMVSCYNQQNGYYSSNLSLVYTDKYKRVSTVDISDCVKDEIW